MKKKCKVTALTQNDHSCQYQVHAHLTDSFSWKSLFYVTLSECFSHRNIKVRNVSSSFIVSLSVSSYPISISLHFVTLEYSVSLRRGVTSCSRIWQRISRNSTHESFKRHLYERPYNTSQEHSGVPREWYSKETSLISPLLYHLFMCG